MIKKRCFSQCVNFTTKPNIRNKTSSQTSLQPIYMLIYPWVLRHPPSPNFAKYCSNWWSSLKKFITLSIIEKNHAIGSPLGYLNFTNIKLCFTTSNWFRGITCRIEPWEGLNKPRSIQSYNIIELKSLKYNIPNFFWQSRNISINNKAICYIIRKVIGT